MNDLTKGKRITEYLATQEGRSKLAAVMSEYLRERMSINGERLDQRNRKEPPNTIKYIFENEEDEK